MLREAFCRDYMEKGVAIMQLVLCAIYNVHLDALTARRSHAVNSAAIATFAQFISRTLKDVRKNAREVDNLGNERSDVSDPSALNEHSFPVRGAVDGPTGPDVSARSLSKSDLLELKRTVSKSDFRQVQDPLSRSKLKKNNSLDCPPGHGPIFRIGGPLPDYKDCGRSSMRMYDNGDSEEGDLARPSVLFPSMR
uniref:Uncharacterized protein n=1 Tax=Parascaris equorum TaxID=6256 RepID=A0A914RS45_PAREQ